MQDDQPYVGLVIRHAYLWRNEANQGRKEGLKARPCVIVRLMETEDGRKNTFICPITHTRPDQLTPSVEIPPQTKVRLGLDEDRSWIILNEVNQFYWKGYDVRKTQQGRNAYGLLPANFTQMLTDQIKELAITRKLSITSRD